MQQPQDFDENDYLIVNLLLNHKLQRLDKKNMFRLVCKLAGSSEFKGIKRSSIMAVFSAANEKECQMDLYLEKLFKIQKNSKISY